MRILLAQYSATLLRVLVGSLAVVVLASCGSDNAATPPAAAIVARVAVAPADNRLVVGATAQLSATATRADGGAIPGAVVTWTSDNPAIASVTSSGLVTAIAVGGPITVTATAQGVRGTAQITVAQVPVATIELTPATVTIESGDTTRVAAALRDASGRILGSRPLTWTSSDPTIASVSSSGVIAGVTPGGPVTVSATVEGISASVQVTVTRAAVQSVVVTPDRQTMVVTTSTTLNATLRDARGSVVAGRAVTWTSSNPAIATVSAIGQVSAVAVGGPVSISASSEGRTGSSAITVINVPVARVVVSGGATELNENESTRLVAQLFDSAGNALTGRIVTWSSDSTALATVDAAGVVRALRAGPVRIRARADGVEGQRSLTVRGLIHRWTFDETGGPGTTFRDNVRGRSATLVRVGARAGSAIAGQVTLAGGARGETDYIALPPGLLRTLSDATIEVWATMHTLRAWSRVFDVGSSPANNLFMAWSMATDPNSDRIGFTVGGTENRLDRAMAPFTRDLQHHIVMAVDDSGGTAGRTRVTLYLDGAPRGSFETTYRLRDLIDDNFWLGRSHFNDETANASYDEVRIHDRVYPASEVRASFVRGPVRSASPVTIQLAAPPGIGDTIRGIDVSFPLRAIGTDAQGRRFPVMNATWSTSTGSTTSVDSTGQVRVRASGRVAVETVIGGTTFRWSAEAVRMRRLRVDPFLATPAAGALWEIPVVIIAYIPTADATLLDVRKAPDHWWLNPLSIDTVEQRVVDYARRVKMGREQGSRFRGYKEPLALPSIGLRITDIFITYELIPGGTIRDPRDAAVVFPDYHKAFADLALVPYMRARGIKEVWEAWSSFGSGSPSYDPTIHDLKDARAGSESNMSSPLTGDISNSWRFPNDLPILDYTWTMYGISTRRSQAEALHNVGHQMEAILSYVAQRQDGNTRLFWRDFVGQNAANEFIAGRAGWTHMPPNTTVNYGYHETSVVQSDIEDWTPANTGAKTAISRATWYGLTYPWPGVSIFGQREEAQWYTYWFQNFPGRGNRIPHGGRWMTNWWAFVGDWDGAIRSSLGLHGAQPAATRGAEPGYAYPATREVPAPIVHPAPRQRIPRN